MALNLQIYSKCKNILLFTCLKTITVIQLLTSSLNLKYFIKSFIQLESSYIFPCIINEKIINKNPLISQKKVKENENNINVLCCIL